MKIYLVRHGQTEWNALGRWQGTTDIELDDIGLDQAAKIAQKMTQYPVQAIYASPLKRAAKTAEVIATEKNLPIIYNRELEEIRLGELEGLTYEEIVEKHADKFSIWENSTEEQTDLGVETNFELQRRAWAAFDEICQKENGDTLIVSHGAWINRLLCKLLHIPVQHRMTLGMNNVGLSIVECKKDGDQCKYTVLTVNDFSHLG